MSISTFDPDQPGTPGPAEVGPAGAGAGGGQGNADSSLSRQIAVIRGMLSTLDTLTTAGQHHTMGKIVRFLAHESTHASRRLSHGNQREFSEHLGHLKRESERLRPDIRAFSRRVDALLVLLAAIR